MSAERAADDFDRYESWLHESAKLNEGGDPKGAVARLLTATYALLMEMRIATDRIANHRAELHREDVLRIHQGSLYQEGDTSPDGYTTLVRPDGSIVATLTEPEDREWHRDLSPVVDELNWLRRVWIDEHLKRTAP